MYFLKTKYETAAAYKKYEAWVETQMKKKVRILNTDREGSIKGRILLLTSNTKARFRN